MRVLFPHHSLELVSVMAASGIFRIFPLLGREYARNRSNLPFCC